jgi:hypothetical protein
MMARDAPWTSSGERSGDPYGGKDERARPTDRARQDFALADIPFAQPSELNAPILVAIERSLEENECNG